MTSAWDRVAARHGDKRHLRVEREAATGEPPAGPPVVDTAPQPAPLALTSDVITRTVVHHVLTPGGPVAVAEVVRDLDAERRRDEKIARHCLAYGFSGAGAPFPPQRQMPFTPEELAWLHEELNRVVVLNLAKCEQEVSARPQDKVALDRPMNYTPEELARLHEEALALPPHMVEGLPPEPDVTGPLTKRSVVFTPEDFVRVTQTLHRTHLDCLAAQPTALMDRAAEDALRGLGTLQLMKHAEQCLEASIAVDLCRAPVRVTPPDFDPGDGSTE